jgi:hypothetical protein
MWKCRRLAIERAATKEILPISVAAPQPLVLPLRLGVARYRLHASVLASPCTALLCSRETLQWRTCTWGISRGVSYFAERWVGHALLPRRSNNLQAAPAFLGQLAVNSALNPRGRLALSVLIFWYRFPRPIQHYEGLAVAPTLEGTRGEAYPLSFCPSFGRSLQLLRISGVIPPKVNIRDLMTKHP